MKLILLLTAIIASATVVLSFPVQETPRFGYESCPTGEADKLNVHLVCHTHNDVGWLKTVDQYFYGANQSIQRAGVQYILDSVVQSLQHDPKKKFIYVETAFFSRWWNEQHDSVRHAVKKLVCNGQLEFIGGGWSMNDEAAAHYNSIIDQMTFGLRVLNDTFGKCGVPKIAWQIDPFGHSREQASLFAQMFFDGLFFGRLDYQDKNHRESTKTMEHVWKASANLGARADLFTGALPNSYSPPAGFCFDILCDDPPIMDDPNLKDYNVEQRVSEFIGIAESQSQFYATNHIVMTMGNDFNYQNAATWFKNLDKLIKHVNEKQKNGSRVNVFYSTPSCYLYALNKANRTWTVKYDDFMPYASDPHAYWTGYFTSRPSIKGYERVGNNKMQVCKQLAARTDIEEVALDFMRRAMGIMQHHDAITGTAKQHVTNDYEQTLAAAIESCYDIVNEAYEKLMPANVSNPSLKQYFCNFLNISQCNITEENSAIAITIYNPLAWNVTEYVRVPVTGKAYKILDYNGKAVEAQVVPVSSAMLQVPGRKSKAVAEVVFQVQLPPLGYATYLLRNSSCAVMKDQASKIHRKAQGDWIIKNEHLTVFVDGKSGLLKGVRLADGSNITVNQSFYWYRGMNGNNSEFQFRASGAYIFRPNGTEPLPLGNNVDITLINGSLVQEIHQIFTPWLSQIVRLYKGSENVEMKWLVGPIPVEDNVGKEIITRFDTDLKTGDLFYTDSNGREMVLRKRNYRPTWTLNLTEPVSGNYYPVNSRIFIQDKKARRQFTVLSDRSQGGSSLKDGSIELMIHRRLLHDDAFGVGEALNETGVDGHGLVITGSHYLLFTSIDKAASKHRPLAQKLFMKPQISFAFYNTSEDEYMKAYKMISPGLKTSLPPNVHFLTLEPWKRGMLLLRFEHFYEWDDDAVLSKPTNFTLKNLFNDFEVLSIDETTLSANQYLDEAKRLRWNIEGRAVHGNSNVTDYHKDVALDHLNINLTPMLIRTFLAKIKQL
ncbi:lysosomal alpha-mannosidase-like isoform X2 [Stegodyphus dumicola]|uniref:lysosomal alpha-mannosidase-like isoform X2 n=1 Tax=Stegodyphus dumicola TaxID=202533 RepID=UPI0015ACAD5E|nr:lysosomal alpha-mannosidase-like isoform X2 [Stegodyphus dumicola]